MKLTKITLSILTTLVFSTMINANDKDKCPEAYASVYGEQDFYGQAYKDFLKEQRSQKTNLDFLVKHCNGTKYESDKATVVSITKNLGRTAKLSEAEWKKEFKYP